MIEWSRLLANRLGYRPGACRWLLDELARSPTALEELLLSPHDVVRDAVMPLVFEALNQSMRTASGRSLDPDYPTGSRRDGDGGIQDAYGAAHDKATLFTSEVDGDGNGGDAERASEERRSGDGCFADDADGFVAVGRDGVGTAAASVKQDNENRRAKKSVRLVAAVVAFAFALFAIAFA